MWKGLYFFYVRFWAIFVPNIKNNACTAQGDFSNSFGFRNKYQQEKYKVDIGFPVEVLEITFNPKVKDHLDTSNIKKMRLHFSAHLMDIALMSHLGGDIPLGKAICIRLAYTPPPPIHKKEPHQMKLKMAGLFLWKSKRLR